MPSGGLADVLIELAQSRSRWRWEVVVASEQETTKHSLMEQGWEPVTAFSEKDGVGVRVMLRRQVRITPDAPDAPEGGTSNAPR
ncbi:MAG: hypothetical protein Q8O76_02530 [Chloroflexota bacterium]|nr:hypothetical protein [Chloroflexota bacterium]